jgi:hypothetical protein
LAAVGLASEEAAAKYDFNFVNTVDTTQGFSAFGFAPAINNSGAVAFDAAGKDFPQGSVSRWLDGSLTTIASSKDHIFSNFGDDVVINSFGTVGFDVRIPGKRDAIIATGDGGPLTTIASATDQGLIGGAFFGISGMNESGTVVFLGVRKGFASQAIFAGRGGPLKTLIDTATDPNFTALGNADINASGKIVFHGFLADGTEGIYSNASGIKAIADTNTPGFTGFLDPVINDPGTAGSAAFLNVGGMEAFTGTTTGITPRTSPASSFFTSIDNVSINNSGDIAFFATESGGGAGIFIELTGQSNSFPVIETGDSLFGSTVLSVSMGRFSVNDHDQIAFRYQLLDGRSGIAIASRKHR